MVEVLTIVLSVRVSRMKIAITGTIGSGKSIACDYLRSKDFYVFDCDKYNSYLLDNDKDVYNEIYSLFPECFDHLRINRKKLASIVFNDSKKREDLENILHPRIKEKMIDESNKHELFFAEVPLLFEKGLESNFDLTILIVSNEKISHLRLSEKGYSQEEIENRELSQLPVQEKIKKTNEIIYNNGSCKDLYNEIDKLLLKYDWE